MEWPLDHFPSQGPALIADIDPESGVANQIAKCTELAIDCVQSRIMTLWTVGAPADPRASPRSIFDADRARLGRTDRLARDQSLGNS